MDTQNNPHGLNVYGMPMELCGNQPMTGFTREGFCSTGPQDLGSHTVCVQMTDAFLAYSKSKGNDLSTPLPDYGFPGLKAGDRWCLCAARWKEAYDDGMAPKVYILRCHQRCLEVVSLELLKQYAIDLT